MGSVNAYKNKEKCLKQETNLVKFEKMNKLEKYELHPLIIETIKTSFGKITSIL